MEIGSTILIDQSYFLQDPQDSQEQLDFKQEFDKAMNESMQYSDIRNSDPDLADTLLADYLFKALLDNAADDTLPSREGLDEFIVKSLGLDEEEEMEIDPEEEEETPVEEEESGDVNFWDESPSPVINNWLDHFINTPESQLQPQEVPEQSAPEEAQEGVRVEEYLESPGEPVVANLVQESGGGQAMSEEENPFLENPGQEVAGTPGGPRVESEEVQDLQELESMTIRRDRNVTGRRFF